MIIYTDIVSGDEMISDAYDIKTVDDIVFEVDCKMVVVEEGQVDIGGNPSAEEQEEALENGAVQVNNVVHSFRLQSTQFDKKAYLGHLKAYMKKIKAHLESKEDKSRLEVFEKQAQAFAKKVIGKFDDYDFYVGESMDPDGMVALLNYREDGVTPYMIFWKDGLNEVKV